MRNRRNIRSAVVHRWVPQRLMLRLCLITNPLRRRASSRRGSSPQSCSRPNRDGVVVERQIICAALGSHPLEELLQQRRVVCGGCPLLDRRLVDPLQMPNEQSGSADYLAATGTGIVAAMTPDEMPRKRRRAPSSRSEARSLADQPSGRYAPRIECACVR